MNQKQTKRYHNLNHKPDKINTKINYDMNYEGRSRRPILYSSEDVERMAIESSRARLMMQLLSEPEEQSDKISSHFGKSNVRPNYTMTSHTAKIPMSNRNFTTYPTLIQGLRWSPSIKAYSEDSQTDTSGEDRKFKWKCQTCEINKYLTKMNPQKNTNSYNFKDNIAKFSDNSTMTRNLRESGCGVRTPLPTVDTSEVSVSTSNVTVKDVLIMQSQQTYPINPPQTLRRSDFQTNHNNNLAKEVNQRVIVDLENSVKNNMCSDYENMLKSYAKQPMVSASSNKNDNGDSRNVLHNEGITTSIANNTLPNFPLHTKQIKSQMKFSKCNRSHGTKKRLGGKQTIIPYTHQTNSKYHYDCKEHHFNNRNMQDDSNYVTIGPVPKKPERWGFTPSIRLPKRVLTSEKDIEAFMDKRSTKISSFFKH